MQNYVQKGDTLDWVNDTGSDVVSGAVVVLGDTVGIAMGDIADTETGSVLVEGVVEIAKVDAAVIAAGEHVNWDASAGEVDDKNHSPASGDVADFGVAVESKGATTGETIKVKLTPGAGTVS
ncbi:MAG: DUF2190 family protein [Pseudomonadaceae bacterium]|nr:DUF2190 family protein [Pseudomonadaceae bacterium]